jgi:hypothetical protein
VLKNIIISLLAVSVLAACGGGGGSGTGGPGPTDTEYQVLFVSLEETITAFLEFQDDGDTPFGVIEAVPINDKVFYVGEAVVTQPSQTRIGETNYAIGSFTVEAVFSDRALVGRVGGDFADRSTEERIEGEFVFDALIYEEISGDAGVRSFESDGSPIDGKYVTGFLTWADSSELLALSVDDPAYNPALIPILGGTFVGEGIDALELNIIWDGNTDIKIYGLRE